MKRSLLVVLLVLLLWGTAQAGINVFYVPESGFLRVSGEMVIEPEAASLSFLIFPTAHLTEFWADHLMEYRVERHPHGTTVILAVRQLGPQTISFSYEGLIEPKQQEAVLGRDQLWLPEFTIPAQDWDVAVQLPLGWEVAEGEVRETSTEGSFSLVLLQPSSSYPNLKLVNYSFKPAEEPEDPEEALVEESEEWLAPVETADLAELGEEPASLEEAEQGEPEEQPRDPFAARVQIQINRFTRALGLRSQAELAELLSPALQEEGLAHYLASLPPYYGRVIAEIVAMPEDPYQDYTVVFSTERGDRYLASMAWREEAGSLQLHQFRLTPYEPTVPKEVADSCELFLQELQAALQMEDQGKISSLLAPDLQQDAEEILHLLFSLDSSEPWTIEHVTLEPFSITVLTPPLDGAKFLLKLDLTPGQYHWLLLGVQVVPLS
ncbi:MAG TPA: hypothetical protein GX014_03470 [Firmicutes bacterium]|nr:hypothetical protein [Bacillota bacterium]HHT42440.1 hypothetical protein [Bacillota bacterium]